MLSSAGRPDMDQLYTAAERQAGYFTAAQARQARFSRNLVLHYINGGRFLRVRLGVYRLRHFPSSPHEDVMAAWLSVGRGCVVSHDTALDLHGLTDLIPAAIHLSVARAQRSLPKFPGVIVHTTRWPLGEGQTALREGLPVTAVERTIVDLSQASWFPPDQLQVAVTVALHQDVTTAHRLREAAAARSPRAAQQVEELIARGQRHELVPA